MAKIGMRIKLKREELGLTQEELANKLGYKSKTTIAKIESGTNDIVQSKVVKFADALETTVAYLMGWDTLGLDENGFLITDHIFRLEIGERLSEKRNERGMSIRGLASRSGIDISELKNIESGTALNIHIDTLKTLANTLNTTVSYLTGQTWDSISMDLSDIEANVINAYREATPDEKHAVNKFLGVWDNPPEHEDDPTIELQKTIFWEKYYSLDERGRKMVDMVLDQEYSHSKENDVIDNSK